MKFGVKAYILGRESHRNCTQLDDFKVASEFPNAMTKRGACSNFRAPGRSFAVLAVQLKFNVSGKTVSCAVRIGGIRNGESSQFINAVSRLSS